MRGWIAAGLSLALLAAGCAEPSYPTTTPGAAPAAPPPTSPPAAQAPLPILPPMPDAMPAPRRATPIASDSCGAAQMQGMVGHLRTLIPVPVDPNRQRVACTTCPKAQDEDPARLNFLFDAGTGVIKEVRCG